MNKKIIKNDYILLLSSQTISQFGSSMTSFALIIWAYKQTNSATTISCLAFFSYLPYILIGIFAGAVIDRFKKKNIMLLSDIASAICSAIILMFVCFNSLKVWNLYILNAVISFMSAFQLPASKVAIGLLVPKDKYSKISGMNTFSNSLITSITPMIATTVMSLFGIKLVLIIDLISFFISESILLCFIKIPETLKKLNEMKGNNLICESLEGVNFLLKNKGLLYLMISFAVMNFLSSLTYENILPAMILSRTNNNEHILAIITGTIGLGGVVGGMVVTLFKIPKNRIKVIFFCAEFSFLFGDVLMGAGQRTEFWIIAAICASFPIVFINAAEADVLYSKIPKEIQGRIFAVRNSVQYSTIPLGLILGGVLADNIFEPLMKSNSYITSVFSKLVGTSHGSGMGLMFVCTGIIGFVSSIILYYNKHVQEMNNEYL